MRKLASERVLNIKLYRFISKDITAMEQIIGCFFSILSFQRSIFDRLNKHVVIAIIMADRVTVTVGGAISKALICDVSSNLNFVLLVSLSAIYALALYELSISTGWVCFEA